ncbi:hypothetical protein K488DRAFT_64556, partial [Vararia minispora EC-137]
GGGPGGLALASTLVKYSDPAAPIAIDLYESQARIGTVGAGISVWPRTRALLQQIGLMGGLHGELGANDSSNGEPVGFSFRKSDVDGPGYTYFKMPMPREPMLIHRSALITALFEGLPPPPLCTIHTSSRLIEFSSAQAGVIDGPVILRFADGSTREADVIIGADGVRSAVRNSMFPGGVYVDEVGKCVEVEPKWTGVVVYRSLITRGMLAAAQEGGHQALTTPLIVSRCEWTTSSGSPCVYLSSRAQHIVTYPISRGELINLLAFVTTPGGYGTEYKGKWVRDASPDEIRASYAGWEPEVQALINSVETTSAWAIHIMEDVPRCAIGRAAILGDALHAMETHFGAGAGQAMEARLCRAHIHPRSLTFQQDAYVLSRLLTHPTTTKANLTAALAAYEKSRLAFSTSVVTSARKVGLMYEYNEGPLPDDEDEGWAERWGNMVHERWKFQWEGDAEDFWKDAEAELLKTTEPNGAT